MKVTNDCIVALSTPKGLGAVGIVRLSGEGSSLLANKIFKANRGIEVSDFEAQKMYLGKLTCSSISDKCLCVFFKAPRSFTGEDVIEFQCHGGQIILEAIVKELISLGARLATNGEFTRRAYLNGKMDLANVEGMTDLINAESEMSSRLAFSLFEGGMTDKVKALQDELEESIAYVEAAFDYPEEDVPPMDVPIVRDTLEHQIAELDKVLQTYSLGKSIKEGISVAILGKPNVGKSSLLNAIIGEDRAIVTNVPGTTRDVLSVKYSYKGISFELFDTAGIRESQDEIEMMGVSRARNILEKANIVVATFDASREEDEEDREIFKLLEGKKAIIVVNKNDLKTENNLNLPAGFEVLLTSAKNNQGVFELKEKLYEMINASKMVSSESLVLTNERHFQALKEARNSFSSALDILGIMPPDCIIMDIRHGWEMYGEITGTTASEHIVDTIFMKLCLGK